MIKMVDFTKILSRKIYLYITIVAIKKFLYLLLTVSQSTLNVMETHKQPVNFII